MDVEEPVIPADEPITSVVGTPDLDDEEEASSSCENTVPEEGADTIKCTLNTKHGHG